MPYRRTSLLAFALTFALSACSGGGPPSSSDAQRALTRQYEQATGQPGMVRGYDNFLLTGCAEDPSGDGFRCDVSGNVVLLVAGTEQRLPLGGAVRFSNASGGWTAHTASP
ncbi:hypothetical protein [Luteimonas sp. TWI1416]|uniref:hypothetical protein n=1 Tax=unclassified Luteimonas TaxID=2629088 RepID=UPI00320AB38A